MNGQRFEGQCGVVTGGASGIGLAIVQRLVAEGARVAVCDLQEEALQRLESEHPGAVVTHRADVTREGEIEEFIASATRALGRIDYAFNVAGGSRRGYIVDLAEGDWDFTVDLCLKGVFLAMKHEARQMLGQGSGAIVNVASLNAHVPSHGGSSYASAKAGVEMLTKNGALELAPHGIRVNAVLPGLVETPLTRRTFDQPEALAAFIERIPMGRAAQPDEIAAPALYLASPDANYVNGASLLVDGAWAVSGYPDMRPFRGTMQFKPST